MAVAAVYETPSVSLLLGCTSACSSQGSVRKPLIVTHFTELDTHPFHSNDHGCALSRLRTSGWSFRKCFLLIPSPLLWWKNSLSSLPDDSFMALPALPGQRASVYLFSRYRRGDEVNPCPPPAHTRSSPELTPCFQAEQMQCLCPLEGLSEGLPCRLLFSLTG